MKYLNEQKDIDLANLDKEFDRLVTALTDRKEVLKADYLGLVEEEQKRISSEIANYKNHLSLLEYNSSSLEELSS